MRLARQTEMLHRLAEADLITPEAWGCASASGFFLGDVFILVRRLSPAGKRSDIGSEDLIQSVPDSRSLGVYKAPGHRHPASSGFWFCAAVFILVSVHRHLAFFFGLWFCGRCFYFGFH